MSVACGMGFQNHASDFYHAFGGYPLACTVPVPFTGAGSATQGLTKSFGQKWEETLASMQASETLGESDTPALSAAQEQSGIASTPQPASGSKPRPAGLIGQDSLFASESFSNAYLSKGSSVQNRRIVRTVVADIHPDSQSDRQEGIGKAAKVVASGSHPQKIVTKSEKPSKVETISPKTTSQMAVSELMLSPANGLRSQSRTDSLQGHPRLAEPFNANMSLENAHASRTSDLKIGASPLQTNGGRQTNAAEIEIQSDTPENDSSASPVISSSQSLPQDASAVSSSAHRAMMTLGETGMPVPAFPEKGGASLLHPSVAAPSVSTVQARSLIDRLSPSHPNFERKMAADPSVAVAMKRAIAQPDPVTDRDTTSPSRVNAGPVLPEHAGNPLGTMPASIAVREEHSAAAYGAEIAPQPALGTSASQVHQSERLREPFAAMDAAATGPASQWTFAGSHRAEAGFQDPSLGWVSVRAQEGGGAIHAAVVPASDIAAQVLGAHLAGLNAHMASQYEHLSPVTLSSPDAGLINQNPGEHPAQRDGPDTGQNGQKQEQNNSQPPRTDAVLRTSPRFVEVESGNMETPVITTGQYPGEQHVSVIV